MADRDCGRSLRWRLMCLAFVVPAALWGCDTPKVAADTSSMGVDGDSGTVDLDWQEFSCEGALVSLTGEASCGERVTRSVEATTAAHVAEETPITYADTPPLAGDHRGQWGKWGEYDYMPPQRYLHNLEHGGVAILYDPCLDDASKETLRAWVRAKEPDTTGAFRWVMTPYAGLPAKVGIIAWQHGLFVDCWAESDLNAAEAFLTDHYRKASEDVPFDGTYTKGWLGR